MASSNQGTCHHTTVNVVYFNSITTNHRLRNHILQLEDLVHAPQVICLMNLMSYPCTKSDMLEQLVIHHCTKVDMFGGLDGLPVTLHSMMNSMRSTSFTMSSMSTPPMLQRLCFKPFTRRRYFDTCEGHGGRSYHNIHTQLLSSFGMLLCCARVRHMLDMIS